MSLLCGLPVPRFPHSSISVPFRERGKENKPHVFREESFTGRVPDQSASSSSAPLASLSSALSLGTGLADLCWNAAFSERGVSAGGACGGGGGLGMMSSGIHSGRGGGAVVAGMVLPLGFSEGNR